MSDKPTPEELDRLHMEAVFEDDNRNFLGFDPAKIKEVPLSPEVVEANRRIEEALKANWEPSPSGKRAHEEALAEAWRRVDAGNHCVEDEVDEF